MYTVTFYSFKGGVGRSLAAANVAAELSAQGRSVLLVDFDLEAPGLATFRDFEAAEDSSGVVEYVTEYLASGQAPDVREFVRQCSFSHEGGPIWLMPAGRKDPGYSSRLQSISWDALYANHDGYLFFEDLREQWRECFSPDYVVIDSRTGHTDVGGICTRQLPDLVVALFFPNAQNLGIETVVSEIRAEETGPRKKKIELLFVPSNVPNLDDENGVLEKQLERFKSKLSTSDLNLRIHHYDSMSLLDQELFSIRRPRSRLAGEYRALAETVMRNNIHDRVGVEKKLVSHPSTWSETNHFDQLSYLEALRQVYAQDPEVLIRLAKPYRFLGFPESALAVLEAAEKQGVQTADLFLMKARLKFMHLEEGVSEDLERVLSAEDATFVQLLEATKQLRRLKPEALAVLEHSDSYQALRYEERFMLVQELLWDNCESHASNLNSQLLRELRAKDSVTATLASHASLALIADKDFAEAADLLAPFLETEHVAVSFNYAMAMWGNRAEPNAELFETFLAHHEAESFQESMRNQNYWQCVALAHAVLDNRQAALGAIESALRRLATSAESFSAWTYKNVLTDQFIEHLRDMSESITSGELRPPVLNLPKVSQPA